MPKISTVISLLPSLINVIKKWGSKPETGQKEAATVGIGAALTLIWQDIQACGEMSLSCVPIEHWFVLASALVSLALRLVQKAKA